MKSRHLYGVVAAALVLAVPVAWGQSPTILEGSNVFGQHCAMCHGAAGKGRTPMGKKLGAIDLTSSAVQGQSDDILTTVINGGLGDMPAFGSLLKPDQVSAVISYVRELSKSPNGRNVRDETERMNKMMSEMSQLYREYHPWKASIKNPGTLSITGKQVETSNTGAASNQNAAQQKPAAPMHPETVQKAKQIKKAKSSGQQ